MDHGEPPATTRAWDVVVIGAGVLGTAIAARLSQTTARVLVLEAAGDVAEGASKGNAGVAVSYYAAPGTLEARLVAATYTRWPEVCRALDVPYRRLGGIITALDEEQAAGLPEILDEALGCGVKAEILDGDAVRRLEPMISDQAVAGLWLEEEGVIDPLRLTVAYAELAARNGAVFRFDSPVTAFERDGDRVAAVVTPAGRFRVRLVVNASGIRLGELSELAGGEEIRMWPRKGEYWLLDREFGSRLQRIVFAAPTTESKGVHVIPTSHGNALLGPSSDDRVDPDDTSTDKERLRQVFERTRRLVPSVSLEYAIKAFAANRPASEDRVHLRFDAMVPNLLHVANRSSGVGSSLGTADHALSLLRDAGLDVGERADAVQALPAVPRLRDHPAPETLTAADPRYGQVVCVCEQVSAAEIAAALASPVPAPTIQGVWKRTGATGGRCQGAICAAGVAFMCSLRYGLPPERVEAIGHGFLGIEP
jgi:glycerol-3-phosphate dehydrogenase